jgi:hypothetical protein
MLVYYQTHFSEFDHGNRFIKLKKVSEENTTEFNLC